MPISVENEIKKKLVELAKLPANRSIFFSLGKRRRILKETSVEAVYVATLNDFKQAGKSKGDFEKLEELKELGFTAAEIFIFTNTYCDLVKYAVKMAEKDESIINKEDVVNLFKSLHELKIGRYIRPYERNKKRFEWSLLTCIEAGKVALLPEYDIEIPVAPVNESEIVVDLKDGRLCFIQFPGEKKGKRWNSFLREIKTWANDKLLDY